MKNVFNFNLNDQLYVKKNDITLFKSNNNIYNFSVNENKLNSEMNLNYNSNKLLENYNQNKYLFLKNKSRKEKFISSIIIKKRKSNSLLQVNPNISKKLSINQKIIKNNKITNKNNNQFTINLFEFLYMKFFNFCNNKKINNKKILYEKCKSKLFCKMDIIEYIQYTRKLELIYYIILNKKERIIINYLKNPYVNLKNELNFYENINLDLYYEIFSNKEINDIILAYNYIINQDDNKNYIKKKIKKFVFNQLKNAFINENPKI